MVIKHFKTISEFHEFRNLPKPEHPLFSVICVDNIKQLCVNEPDGMVFPFFTIAFKRATNLKVKYGQHDFDFNEGVLSFSAPNRMISLSTHKEGEIKQSGWVICIHPDFLLNTNLSKGINEYDFWDYSYHEALFLSEKEELVITTAIKNILQEYQANIDRFSKSIILSHIEALLNYSNRFYNRQFITREKVNHQLLDRLEGILREYYKSDKRIVNGLPTVAYLAASLNISPKYLSGVLRILTGHGAQQYIHEKIISMAKEKLSGTTLSISEIAYELGFEHLHLSASYSKLKPPFLHLNFDNH